jgi:hypothetical protein
LIGIEMKRIILDNIRYIPVESVEITFYDDGELGFETDDGGLSLKKEDVEKLIKFVKDNLETIEQSEIIGKFSNGEDVFDYMCGGESKGSYE